MVQFRGIPVGRLGLPVPEPRRRRGPRAGQRLLHVRPSLEEGRKGPPIGGQEGPRINARRSWPRGRRPPHRTGPSSGRSRARGRRASGARGLASSALRRSRSAPDSRLAGEQQAGEPSGLGVIRDGRLGHRLECGVPRGAAVHPRAGATRRRGSGWERPRIVRGREGRGDPGCQRRGPTPGSRPRRPGSATTRAIRPGPEVVVLDRDLLEARRPRPEKGRVEARRPCDPEPLLILADPAALPVEDGGVLLLDADQIEAATDERVRRVPRGVPAALRPRPAGARRRPGAPPARPIGRASGSRARPPRGSPRCPQSGTSPCLEERGRRARDPSEGWPRAASQGLPQVPLEQGVGHRPEETGPLIPDRLWEPEHVRESVRRRTAVPGLEARRAEPRKAAGLGSGQSTMLMTASLPGDASTAMRLRSHGMPRPDSRRKREGGRTATSPQSRRIRATGKTS